RDLPQRRDGHRPAPGVPGARGARPGRSLGGGLGRRPVRPPRHAGAHHGPGAPLSPGPGRGAEAPRSDRRPPRRRPPSPAPRAGPPRELRGPIGITPRKGASPGSVGETSTQRSVREHERGTSMSDREEHEPTHHLSRRTVLRLGLVAASVGPALAGRAHAQADKIGANLIGKLEGPELVTDPAKMPKTFKEAPELAELVKAGKLPPVEQRIGQDPLVIKPLRDIGKYGGTWRRGFTGPFDTSNGHRTAQNDKLLYFDYTGTKIVPNIARGWEVSPDGRVTTIFLRRG